MSYAARSLFPIRIALWSPVGLLAVAATLSGDPEFQRPDVREIASGPADTDPVPRVVPQLYIEPIAGLTTVRHRAPDRTAIPLGTELEVFLSAPEAALVSISGATITFRDADGVWATCTLDRVGPLTIEAVADIPGGATFVRTCELDVVSVPLEDITATAISASVVPFDLDENATNAQTMEFFFRESIASFEPLPDGYLTSTGRRIQLTVDISHPEFGPLMEWRAIGSNPEFLPPMELRPIGQPTILGQEATVYFQEPGMHTVEVGPPTQSAYLAIETYEVFITSHQAPDIVGEDEWITFQAATDPPGHEDRITWLSSTKYGSGTPVVGDGAAFTAAFYDTFGPVDGLQWLGVRADNATFNQDHSVRACCFDDGSCTESTAQECQDSGGQQQGGIVNCEQATCCAEAIAIKVPLGGSLGSTDDPGCFKVYVPTKWGGKLNVSTTGGTVTDLEYPDGSAYTNNIETGENKHGWYTFTVRGSNNYTVSSTFTQQGEATNRPWNFYWWSKKSDYIREPTVGGNGTANTMAAATDVQVIVFGGPVAAGGDIVLSGPDGTLETGAGGDDKLRTLINLFDNAGAYQPLVKYDARHATAARAWEVANHSTASFEWCGHCLGGAMASILLNQPAPVGGSAYNTDEVEGLWGELGEAAGIYTIPDGFGGMPAGPPAPGADGTDAKIPEFHALLEEWIKNGQVALQSNLRSVGALDSSEVWNHAVYKFLASYEEAPGGNEKIVKITNELFANEDLEPVSNGGGDRELDYVYIVEYTAGGAVDTTGTKDFISVAGEASFAPSNLLHVTAAAWGGANPHVTLANVKADDGAN